MREGGRGGREREGGREGGREGEGGGREGGEGGEGGSEPGREGASQGGRGPNEARVPSPYKPSLPLSLGPLPPSPRSLSEARVPSLTPALPHCLLYFLKLYNVFNDNVQSIR